ncbi:MAG: ankyrin repeat domain-containing protein [Fibromonadaceae bacterium]|jgi:ankyrin repeat protein|nr:ankyrin repeat domain-containing protein [Fibromonadaceae bacterium]
MSFTDIFEAAEKGTIEDLKYFLEEKGVDVNTQDEYGQTALHVAVSNESLEVVKFLVSKGSNVNMEEADGKTPLHLAATYNNNVEVAKILISNGAKVNATNKWGYTPLHNAATGESIELVRFLVLEGKADVEARDEQNGGTPLRTLVSNGKSIEIIKFLVSEGKANVNAKDNGGTAPLQAAIMNGNIEFTKILITAGADVNVKCDKGLTSLSFAIYAENVELTKILVDAGADVNARDNNGITPLHGAAIKNNLELAKILVSAGANANVKNNDGLTPLYFAKENGNMAMVQCFSSVNTAQSSESSSQTLSGTSLKQKLQELQANAENDKEYTIVVTNDESIGPQILSFSDKSNIIVRLVGDGEKIISLEGNGSLFTVESGITLILDSDVTLQGHNKNSNPLVNIKGNGILIMNAGAKIKGNTGGGVDVNNNGSFVMKGGEISRNVVSGFSCGGGGVSVDGSFTMEGGKIFSNGANAIFGGGGVYVNGNFTMKGGEIFGNIASPGCGGGGGLYVTGNFTMEDGKIFGNVVGESGGGVTIAIGENGKGSFIKTGGTIYGLTGDNNANRVTKGNYRGHAVCVLSNAGRTVAKYRDTTFGPGSTLDSSLSSGWEGGAVATSGSSIFEESAKPSSGCYVATAVYGSYDAPEVLCLRRFRDEMLSPSVFGRLFISLYYCFSPPIAERLKGVQRINMFVRKVLDKVVGRLNKRFHNQNEEIHYE